jgi:O-antigen/teichoic acid export membrane protein
MRGVLTGVLSEMNTRIDVLMLGLVYTDAMVGVYSFAAILAEGFFQLSVAVRNNADPRLGQYFAHGQRAEITAFARQIRRYFFPVMFGIGILAVVVYPLVLTVISSPEHLTTSWLVFGILITGYVLTSGYTPFNGLLLIGNLPGWQTGLMLLTTITSISLNALLIPLLGLYGAALATAMTFIVSTIALVIIARYRLDVIL